jgi:hypothetical protein
MITETKKFTGNYFCADCPAYIVSPSIARTHNCKKYLARWKKKHKTLQSPVEGFYLQVRKQT